MKKTILLLFILIISINAKAQFTSYSPYDVEYGPVMSVEEMSQYEIKTYNNMLENGWTSRGALMAINAARAQDNLKAAPATIIEINSDGLVEEEDSLPQYIGASNLWTTIINTTPKTIKEITLTFSFLLNGNTAYSIKDGSPYCIMTFENIPGRTNSNYYKEITNTVNRTVYVGGIGKATYFKPFYNSKATQFKLEKVFIKYADGTTSTKAALFDETVLNYKLYEDGPLKPLVKYLDSIR